MQILKMIKTLVLGAVGACCGLLGLVCGAERGPSEASPPNFIFFFTDDQGWGDMSCAGHPYLKTPHLDRLASGGTRFGQFYSAASVCSPSRVAFMTGHFPTRHGIHRHLSNRRHNEANGMPHWLDPEATTLTRVLQEAGYRTGHFGKWHLGHVEGAPEPGAYGIDEHRVLGGTGPGWDRHGRPAETDLAHASYHTCTDQDRFWTHSTDLIVDEAIAFLEDPQNRPFYLNLWTILPHAPNRPTAEQLAEYAGIQPKPGDFQSWLREYAEGADDLQAQMQTYAAVMGNIDAALGRLLDKMEELGLMEDTLILFTSDNGPEDYHIGNVANSGMGSTARFRGRKRSLYEGGIRMPCIAHWPGHIPAGRTDAQSVVAAVDWFPTVCRLAGVELPDIRPDGEDVSGILRGQARARKTPLFWEWRGYIAGDREANLPPALAIREGKWKLFAQPDGTGVKLYDIPSDPEERNDLSEEEPAVVERLLPRLLKWKKTIPGYTPPKR
jgi:N-acetylgalactosamine-6-sulfatase